MQICDVFPSEKRTSAVQWNLSPKNCDLSLHVKLYTQTTSSFLPWLKSASLDISLSVFSSFFPGTMSEVSWYVWMNM